MSYNRYKRAGININTAPEYLDILRERKTNSITHYGFVPFKRLKVKDVFGVKLLNHRWTIGDRFFKLAYKHYGDPLYWWVIAFYNNTPLESDMLVGDTVYIPKPLEVILSALEI